MNTSFLLSKKSLERLIMIAIFLFLLTYHGFGQNVFEETENKIESEIKRFYDSLSAIKMDLLLDKSSSSLRLLNELRKYERINSSRLIFDEQIEVVGNPFLSKNIFPGLNKSSRFSYSSQLLYIPPEIELYGYLAKIENFYTLVNEGKYSKRNRHHRKLEKLSSSNLFSIDIEFYDVENIVWFTRMIEFGDCQDCWRFEFSYNSSLKTLTFPKEWKQLHKRSPISKVWVKAEVKVSKKGVLLNIAEPQIIPFALISNDTLFLIQEKYRLNIFPRSSNSILMDRSIIFQTPSYDPEFSGMIAGQFLNSMIEGIKQYPFNAEIDEYFKDDLAILSRTYKKNDLLNGKYEFTGYLIKVDGRYSEVELLLTSNVLTANHPDNKFYDPSDREFNAYIEALQNLKLSVINDICEHYTCVYQRNNHGEGILIKPN